VAGAGDAHGRGGRTTGAGAAGPACCSAARKVLGGSLGRVVGSCCWWSDGRRGGWNLGVGEGDAEMGAGVTGDG